MDFIKCISNGNRMRRFRKVTNAKYQKPAITRAPEHFLLVGAGQCRTSNHSHSIVAGGLLDTS